MIARFGLAAIVVIALIGCDDQPAVPAVLPTPTPTATTLPGEEPRPTAAELAVTKTESLTVLPLMATVPQSWTVTTDLGQTVLKGFTPHHQVRVRLAARPKLAADAFERLLEGARREAAKPDEKDRFKLFDIREQNGLRVLEQQKIGPNDPTVGTPLSWTTWFCEKKGDSYEIYELSINDLSWEDFQKDQTFLRNIILSVKPSH